MEDGENCAVFFTPNIVFALLLLIIVAMTYVEYRKRKLFWPVDAVLLFVQGVAGLLIAFMVLFSVHPTVGSNLLVLLFNPLPLVLLPIYIYNIIKGRKQNIMWMQTIMVAQFLVLSPFIPQYIPVAIYMFAVTLLIRSLYITQIRK